MKYLAFAFLLLLGALGGVLLSSLSHHPRLIEGLGVLFLALVLIKR